MYCLLGYGKEGKGGSFLGSHHLVTGWVGGGVWLDNSLSKRTCPLLAASSGPRALSAQRQLSGSDHASQASRLWAAFPSLSARPQGWQPWAPGPLLRPAAVLPAGLPPLAQTLAQAPPGSPPAALARRTFSKQCGSLCTTRNPSEAAPYAWPTARPGANLTPCHTPLWHLLRMVPLLPGPHTRHLLGTGSCLTAWSQMRMSPWGNPARSLAPKGLPLSRAGVQDTRGMECLLFGEAVPEPPASPPLVLVPLC